MFRGTLTAAAMLAVMVLAAPAASAGSVCEDQAFIADYECWDLGLLGEVCLPVYEMTAVCTVTADDPGDSFAGADADPWTWTDYPPIPVNEQSMVSAPTITIAYVETTDPTNAELAADVTIPSGGAAPASVSFYLDQSFAQSLAFSGSGRYVFHLPIAGRADGSIQLAVSACSTSGCGASVGTMSRYTPGPLAADGTLVATWNDSDLDENGNVEVILKEADYGHAYRQLVTGTTFNIYEIGENSRFQFIDGSATLNVPPADAIPLWNAEIDTNGTINNAFATLTGCGSFYGCSRCVSQCGSPQNAFAYGGSAHDLIWNVVVENGTIALISGNSMEVSP
jgi:hypothetical protein